LYVIGGKALLHTKVHRSYGLARSFALVVIVLQTTMFSACASRPNSVSSIATAEGAVQGRVISYTYASLDERVVSSESMQGRATALAFLTTYGDASLAQAKFLNQVYQHHVPPVHVAVVFVERRENRPLMRLFREALGVSYPLAFADSHLTTGEPVFPSLDAVPTVVVLDGAGQEQWRKVGIATPEELHKALKKAQNGRDDHDAQTGRSAPR